MSADALAGALSDLRAALEESGSRYMLIGGVAVVAWGVARLTRDVDATVWADGLDLEVLLAALGRRGIHPRSPDAAGIAARDYVLLLSHERTRTPIEVTLALLPFESEALSRSVRRDVAGSSIPIPDITDLIVYKVAAWRPGDREDVRRLVAIHRGSIDAARVVEMARQFGEALDDPQREDDVRAVLDEE